MFASEAAPYGFIWHLDFLIFTLLSRPNFLNVDSSIALTVAPLSGSTVRPTPLISTFFRGLLSDGPMGFTSCSMRVDSSSLLSDDMSDFCSSTCATSLVALTSWLLLHHFAKWFLFPHRVHCFLKAGHFLGPPSCGQCFPQLKHDFSLLLPAVILSTSCLTVTSFGACLSTFVACWSALSRPLAYLRASTNVSWSCNNFLLTLLDLPFSIMAISISVSNRPAGKSQCSPSAVSLAMNESQVSSLPCLMQRNFCILKSRFCDFLNLFSSALMAPSRSVPVSPSCSNISRVLSPIESKNNDRCCAFSVML